MELAKGWNLSVCHVRSARFSCLSIVPCWSSSITRMTNKHIDPLLVCQARPVIELLTSLNRVTRVKDRIKKCIDNAFVHAFWWFFFFFFWQQNRTFKRIPDIVDSFLDLRKFDPSYFMYFWSIDLLFDLMFQSDWTKRNFLPRKEKTKFFWMVKKFIFSNICAWELKYFKPFLVE